MASTGLTVNVLYGTVTGNAEEIARRIHSELENTHFSQGLLRCLADYADISDFTKPASVSNSYNVIVVSTTGDGDPPETIRPFMRLIRKKDPEKLKGLQYAVLGLGDTNYENFCNTGKRIDSALSKMGANRFHKRGDADDGVGLELVVEPWLKSLWQTLDSLNQSIKHTDDTPLEVIGKKPIPSEDEPTAVQETDKIAAFVKQVTNEELGFPENRLPKVFPPKVIADVIANPKTSAIPLSLNPSFNPQVVRTASVTDARRLTAVDADKLVWHMEVTCSVDNAIEKTYRPGDAFGVIVENDELEVNRFLKTINADGESCIELKKENGDVIAVGSVSQFVRQRIDLRAIPKKTLLRSMSEHCENLEERKQLLFLSSKDGRRKYTEEVTKKNLSILSLLEQKAPSCRAPLSLFLDQLPGVAPRWYSATSSPELDGQYVLQFAFSVVEHGLATNHLSKLCQGFLDGEASNSQVLLIPRESDSTSSFRPPKALSTSYIMIGPGTGVAPFRGFLRERSAEMKSCDTTPGKAMLFFGCRNAEKDFLYESDLKELEESGVLTSLDVAFSRDGPDKVYVQDRLSARSQEVADVVKSGGSIYVCGDGGGMAQGVHMALGKILSEHCCDGNDEEGKNMVRALAEEHRYVRDIWYYG